jgi:hypothetical protein
VYGQEDLKRLVPGNKLTFNSGAGIEIYEKKHLKDKKELKSKTKHRLLVCSGCCGSENKKSTFWNRDVNACLNMLKLTHEWINTKSRNVLFSRI